MILTLKVECEWGSYLQEECIRFLEIDSHASLYDLHLAIQDAVNFDNDHLFEFYAGRHCRNRKIEFAQDSWDWGWEEAGNEYREITLEEIYPLPKGLKLYYHFDFGDDWIFKIINSRRKPTEPEKGIKYPRVIKKIGSDPEQYPNF